MVCMLYWLQGTLFACLVLGGLITASTASVTVTVTQRLDTPSARLRVWRMVVIQNSVQLAICFVLYQRM